MIDSIAVVFIFIGALFILIASIGVLRYQSTYMKMHAATKASTLGSGLILLGVSLTISSLHSITEAILLIFFMTITNPISTHLIAKASYEKKNDAGVGSMTK